MHNSPGSSKTELARPEPVLLIAPQPFFLNRGTPINVLALVSALSKAGYRVDLLVYPFGEAIELSGVRILRSAGFPGIKSVPIGPSWQKLVLDVFLVLKALMLILRNSYSVIHGIEEGGCIAGILSRLKGIGYIFDMDSCMPQQLEESGFIKSRPILWLISKIESMFVRRASAVLTVCQALTDKTKAVDPNVPIYQIEDFPLESATVVDSVLVQNLTEQFSGNQRKILLYTGNLEVYQGIELLLRSFAAAFKKKPHIENAQDSDDALLLLVGGGALNGQQIALYRSLAEELGILEQVAFTGSRPSKEMGSFMALADVLVSPRTEGENTPLKLYSYMAAGKPIVATKISSHEQVLDEKTAFLAEPEQEAFASALLMALDRSAVGVARQMKMAEAAKELVETRYSEKEFQRRLLNMYQDVIGPPHAGQMLGDQVQHSSGA